MPEEEYPLLVRSICLDPEDPQPSSMKTVEVCVELTFQNGSQNKRSSVTCTDKCCNIIRTLNLAHIIRTHADHYHYAETIQNQLRNITFAKIHILIENTPRSTAKPEGIDRLLQCGPITDFSKYFCKWGSPNSHIRLW